MIRKYKNLGTVLSQKEMKQIRGGLAPTSYLWRCDDPDGDGYYDLCSSISGSGEETPDCGLRCVLIGTCPTPLLCIYD